MKTFFNILQTIVNRKNKRYPDEPFIIIENNDLPDYTEEASHIVWLINNIYNKEKKCDNTIIPSQLSRNTYAKFGSLNDILNNSFYTTELKEYIFDVFSKSQKYYYAFSRLARIYKLNKYNFVVTDDLYMSPLDIKHRNTFMLLENKCKYLFSLNELINIIETSIGNSPNFFSDPIWPLNPYNNQQFTISTLYNIYFKMKNSGRLISILFHYFFLEEFNTDKFSQHYEPYIRENAIKKYVFNSPNLTLHSDVLEMLKSNPYTKLLIIHKDFPKELLVDIFRPFLFYYYIVNYDIKGTDKVYNYKLVLNYKLKHFYKYNNAFGRQYIKVTTFFKKIIKKEYKFNTDHITFYKIPYKRQSTIYSDQFILINNSRFIINTDEQPDELDDVDDEQTDDVDDEQPDIDSVS
jgi:hypothetical protein